MSKVAHLGTVTLDTKLATSKQLNADEILANGEDVAEMFNREHAYREMETRVKLEPEDNYILYTDDGTVVTANLSGVANGTRLFSNQSKLTEIPLTWKLDSITDGTSMCASCTNLTSFLHPLNNLSNGSEMFNGCNLNEESVENILVSLPEYTSGTHSLTLNMSTDAFEKFNEITRNIATTPETVLYKGWNIASNAIVTLPVGYRKVEYLESTGTQYIDTGIKLSNESEVTCMLETQDIEALLARQVPYGVAGNPSWQFYCFSQFVETSNSPSKSVFYLPNNWIFTKNRIVGKCNIIHNKRGITINDTTTPTVNEVTEYFETDSGCYLFTALASAAYLIGRIYSFSISHNGKLQLNLIPCLDDTGAPCMYDTVNHTTFYNQGASAEEGGKDFLYPIESTTYSLRRTIPDWGKLTEHGLRRLYHAPEGYTGELHDYALANGFKPIVECDAPEEGCWTPRWTETEEEIILEWDITSNAIIEEEELTNV